MMTMMNEEEEDDEERETPSKARGEKSAIWSSSLYIVFYCFFVFMQVCFGFHWLGSLFIDFQMVFFAFSMS